MLYLRTMACFSWELWAETSQVIRAKIQVLMVEDEEKKHLPQSREKRVQGLSLYQPSGQPGRREHQPLKSSLHSAEDALPRLDDSYLCLCWLTSGLLEFILGVSCLGSCRRLNNRLFWPTDRMYFGMTYR